MKPSPSKTKQSRIQSAPSRRPVHAPSEILVSLVFFASGAAGLIFEVIWLYRCGLVFGNSIWAASVVLSSFMGGLALGGALVAWFGHRIRGFLRTYAALEAVVAGSGVAVTYGVLHLTSVLLPVIRPAFDTPWLVNFIRFASAFAVLIVPATAMGATLPVLVGALCRVRPGFGRALGRLYGWNTLGAVAGVVGAEFFLITRIGVSGTAWVAALLSASAAAIALWMSRRAGELASDSPPGESRLIFPSTSWRLLTCAFLAGGGLMALEVLWFRFLSGFVIITTLALSLMLAVVLAAIGLGALATSSWLTRKPQDWAYLPVVAFAACCVLIGSYWTFQVFVDGTQVGEWYRILWLTCSLTLATSFVSGVLFTLIGEALKRRIGAETAAAGWLTLSNTTGAMCGALVATFVLLPGLGMERSFFALALVYAAIALLARRETVLPRPLPRPTAASWTFWVAAASAVIVLTTFPFGMMSSVYFQRSTAAYTRDGGKLVATREGPTETIFLFQRDWMGKPLYQRLITNGFSMTATTLGARRYMRYFVYWPALVSGQPIRRVLVICYGVGITVGAATDLPSVESVDVVEISRDIVAMSEAIYSPEQNPLRDRRVRLHIEDGRHFLQVTEERFDLITGEPPPPLAPGSASLYSREHFQLMRDRLSDGGIATYWLPAARTVGYDTSAVIRAFCEVFEDCSLWNGTPLDLMLVGTRHAKRPLSVERLSRLWTEPSVMPGLRDAGFELTPQIGATFLGDAGFLRRLTAETPPLTDDYPHRILLRDGTRSLADLRSDSDSLEFYREVLDPDRARRLFESSDYIRGLWPEDFATETLPFFEYQRMFNRLLLEGGNPLRHIEDLHAVLTRTSLRRLPLWMLGSDDVQQNIAETADDSTGLLDWVIGVRALAARDYLAAAEYFAQAEERGLPRQTTRPLLVYALCLGGRLDAAKQLARDIVPDDPDSSYFWNWLRFTFGVETKSAPQPR